jgi:ribosome maturation factor RimP
MPKEKSAPVTLDEKIRAVVASVLRPTDYFLVDLEIRGHRGTRVVEVFVDGDDGIGHDELAAISREVGFELDVDDVVPGSYTLDVSSPGIKRPLTAPRQYQKNVGRELRIKYQASDDESTQYEVVTLTAADADTVTVELPSGDTRTLPYRAIERAKIELPW